jgi:hypothetical protein
LPSLRAFCSFSSYLSGCRLPGAKGCSNGFNIPTNKEGLIGLFLSAFSLLYNARAHELRFPA